MREYEGRDGVVVEWRPELCQHSERCWRALPQVFDPDRRPWIDAVAAPVSDVVAAVAACPSGALRISGAAVDTGAATEITVSRNGPLLLRGDIRILDADGTELAHVDKAALCRCGRSQNKPFCDGSHKTSGFSG